MTPTLKDTIGELRRLLARLERFTGDSRPIDQQVLDALADADLSTSALAALIRRRRADVLSTVKLMHAAGRIGRRNGRWTIDV